MKTTAVAVTALLASTVFAQPYHGRHLHKKNLHKREYVTTWVTETQTATLIIDQYGTSLIEPSPGQFYPSTSKGTTSTTSTSTSTTSTSSSTPTTSTPTTSSTSTTPTSTYVQPTTTTQAQETTPTTTTQAPAYTQTTSVAAAPTSTSGSGSSGGGSGYSGDITFYELGLTSCGNLAGGETPTGSSTSNPAVVALSYVQMRENWPTGNNPNNNPLCGKLIKITANGRTGYGKVMDTCEGCQSGSIDVNVQAFEYFWDASTVGRAAVSWEWA